MTFLKKLVRSTKPKEVTSKDDATKLKPTTASADKPTRRPSRDSLKVSTDIGHGPRSSSPPRAAAAASASAPPASPEAPPASPLHVAEAPPPSPPMSQSQRCYRLSLENEDFDIHSKPSPLEYGDYMTPWKKEDLPKCAGPIEYVPPVHLQEAREPPIVVQNDSIEHEFRETSPEDEGDYDPDAEDGSDGIFRREANYAGTGFFSFPEDAPPPKPKIAPRKKKSIISTLRKSITGKKEKKAEVKVEEAKKARPCHADTIAQAVHKVDDYSRDFETGDERKELSAQEKEEHKKKLVSIYAVGTYEILDDLARDGSKRLRNGKDLSDAELMTRNRPGVPLRPVHQMIETSFSEAEGAVFANGKGPLLKQPSPGKKASVHPGNPGSDGQVESDQPFMVNIGRSHSCSEAVKNVTSSEGEIKNVKPLANGDWNTMFSSTAGLIST